MKKTKKIPKFGSYKEEAKFWDSHSGLDYFAGSIKAEFVPEEKSQHITVKLTPKTKNALKVYAENMAIAPSTLVRVWISERLNRAN